MSDHELAPDHELAVEGGTSRVGWFAAGAFTVAAVIGLFLYSDGYFRSAEVTADTPKVIIEGN